MKSKYKLTNNNWDIVFGGMIAIALAGLAVFLLMWGAKADGYDETDNK